MQVSGKGRHMHGEWRLRIEEVVYNDQLEQL